MNELFLALSLLVAAGIGGLSVYAHGLRVLRPCKRVLVSTNAGYGASGVLHKRSHRTIVLRDARVTSEMEDRPPVPIDGELVIDRDQILWIQVVA
jgi:hypothetical protein